MAGTVNGGNSPIRDYMLGVNRLTKDLKNDEARAAVLGGAVDQMAKSPDADPSLRDLASRMKEVVAPSSGTAAPLQDARMRTALAETVVEGINTNIPLHRELMVDAKFTDGGTNIHYLEEWLSKRDR